MASAFAHALVAISIGNTYSKKISGLKFWLLGCLCAVMPDFDVLGFKLGVPYDSFFGHRGFFHSLAFSAIIGILFAAVFYRDKKLLSREQLTYALFFFLCYASHGLCDMFTSGGLGVAIFSPFDTTRYFFPWRPIRVSPMSVTAFFSEWGFRVIKSEFIWVGLPCLGYILLLKIIRNISGRRN